MHQAWGDDAVTIPGLNPSERVLQHWPDTPARWPGLLHHSANTAPAARRVHLQIMTPFGRHREIIRAQAFKDEIAVDRQSTTSTATSVNACRRGDQQMAPREGLAPEGHPGRVPARGDLLEHKASRPHDPCAAC